MLKRNKYFISILSVILICTALTAIAFGAVHISLQDMYNSVVHFFDGSGSQNIYEGVFLQIRLPRVLLCMITGAVLAVAGVLMQGLFRNPIVEPGLVGTSAGAAFGASIVFVLTADMGDYVKTIAGPLLVPLFSFCGGLLATFLVYKAAKHSKKIAVTNLLLVGIAVNAVGLSGTGFMSYIARDPQARSITFWNLGTFSGAAWMHVLIVGVVAIVCFFISRRFTKQLNALALGEDEAGYIGVNTSKLKRNILLLTTASVSIATAFVGVIAFVGLIVPHVMRLLVGSDHRKLLPASMIGGSIILLIADMGARLLLAPAEIPIGIITSLIGAPVFILLLKRMNILLSK
jgi:iron complex transport system permease protein